MVDPAAAKAALRSRMRAARRSLAPEDRNAETASTVATCLGLVVGLAPRQLASYAAAGGELDLAGIHLARWAAGLPVLLPRVVTAGVLDWHLVQSPDQLIAGTYGIPAPDPARAPRVRLDPGALVLVPGTAFTADGRRLGQGGGFYDRVLGPGLVAVGIGFACQLVDELPTEPHDRRLSGLVIAGRLVLDPRLS